MGESVNVGEISVDITARNEKFDAGIKQTVNVMDGFNTKMLTSKRFVKDFAELSDTPAKPILAMVRAFGALPGPIGVALGALTAAKMAYDHFSEAAQKNAEKIDESVKKTEETLKKHEQTLEKLNEQFDTRTKRQKELAEAEKGLSELAEQRAELSRRGTDKDIAAIIELNEKAKEYYQTIDRLKKAQADDKFQSAQDYAAKQREEASDRFEKDLKQQQEMNAAIEKQAEASTDAMKKKIAQTEKANQSPLEKLEEQLKDYQDQLMNGLSGEMYNRAISKAYEAFDEAEKKQEKKEAGTFKDQKALVFNSNFIDPRSATPIKSDEVERLDEIREIAKGILEEAKKKSIAVLGAIVMMCSLLVGSQNAAAPRHAGLNKTAIKSSNAEAIGARTA